MGIICDLLRNKDITPETFVCVKNANRTFLSTLYLDYIILKRKCSYDLSGYKESLRVFYSYKEIRNEGLIKLLIKIIKRIIFVKKIKVVESIMNKKKIKKIGGGYRLGHKSAEIISFRLVA